MLYVTTTERNDAFTSARTYLTDRGTDGGLFVPRSFPSFDLEQWNRLSELPFCDRIAFVLNYFFPGRLSEIDLAIGSDPVKLQTMSHRIVVAELWRNALETFDNLELVLAEKIRGDGNRNCPVSSWLRIAIRIAILFAVFAELKCLQVADWNDKSDISLVSGDFSSVMSAWYARKMGLPVGNIVCSCNENSAVWDLLHYGEMKTVTNPISTTTPLADIAIPAELERLIFGTLGYDEVAAYHKTLQYRGVYVPPADLFNRLREGMVAAVVSRSRIDALIPSVYRTNSYVMGPYTALAYGGLTDYRAKTGENRTALIWAERAPVQDAPVVVQSMGITMEELCNLQL